MTPKDAPGHLSAFDGLRGGAVLLVFFSHTLQIPTGGYLGVDVFFVLSGFLITSILFDQIESGGRPDFLHFFWRRALRLLPAFLCAAALYAAVRYCFAPNEAPLGPLSIVEVLLLSNAYIRIPYLSHVWSLSLEWQFYLVWPFALTALARAMSGRGIALLCCLAAAALWVLRFAPPADVRLGGLLIGAALAAIKDDAAWSRLRPGGKVAGAAVMLASAAILALAFASDYPGTRISVWAGFLGVPLLSAVIVAAASRSRAAADSSFLSNPLLTYFGRISYGFYLYHFPVAAVMFVHGYSPLASALAGVIVCVPLADFSWRYVERPLIAWGRTNSPERLASHAWRRGRTGPGRHGPADKPVTSRTAPR